MLRGSVKSPMVVIAESYPRVRTLVSWVFSFCVSIEVELVWSKFEGQNKTKGHEFSYFLQKGWFALRWNEKYCSKLIPK